MKKILGLDPGTNSIGWGVIDPEQQKIEASGSRIIPMTQDVLGAFEKGKNVDSPASQRTTFRMMRRAHERKLLRRERLHRALDLMGFLPEHYSSQIDRYGKILPNKEPKLAWKEGETGKMEFLFMDSYQEMLMDFAKYQPELLLDGRNVPYDWTIYYLRNKALTQPLTKNELAWILLQFNQKRGYSQTRDEVEEENNTLKKEYLALTVSKVEKTEEHKGDSYWYNVFFKEREDIVYRRQSKFPLDWVGKVKEFILTTALEKDGSIKLDKDGMPKYSLKQPDAEDWTLRKVKSEASIDQSGLTVGAYIYKAILQRPSQKIIGQLVRIIDRRYYVAEARCILQKQKEFIPELSSNELYGKVIEELYPSNDAYRNSISQRDFTYLLVDDILFYQRPLKSKKSLIDNCPYESREYKDKKTGLTKSSPIKCISKSNPYFQEFRLWQFISNLRIFKRGDLKDEDVTAEFLPNQEAVAELFEWLNNQSSIKQASLLKHIVGKKQGEYRWNYVEDKEYPCNKTRAQILNGLKKAGIEQSYLTHEHELALWHIIYSVTNKTEYGKAIKKYADRNGLGNTFKEVFSKMKPFEERDYGAYSEKAIKKLLPLMRVGKYWSEKSIDACTFDRITKCINGEADDTIGQKVREVMADVINVEQCQGLPVWKACYLVYNRHSEGQDIVKWRNPDDIDAFLGKFKHNSLRNPIVEQVVLETMRTVRDIWKQVGQIDEIHVEIGRDLKNPKEQRARIAQHNQDNESQNMRIRMLLSEFSSPEFDVADVRPYSPSQQELLRIYEEDAWNSIAEPPQDIADIRSKIGNTDPSKRPTSAQVLRYKCWLDQKYISPYTGQPIPLSKLFTPAYQIEHVIPQARFFDDSFNNKVICESEVNALKSKMLGMEFIEKNPGRIVALSGGRTVKILHKDAYIELVKKMFSFNKKKLQRMLMDDIPDDFIERQLNDSRYISRYILSLLSNVVRAEDEQGNLEQEAVSKNVIVCNGNVTTRLKKDWGVGDVWNQIIINRFQRMNEKDSDHVYTTISAQGHVIPDMPLELRKGFDKKRIDHRHHAMDAIVIACCTRDHVNLLNNEAALSHDSNYRYDLSRKLRNYERIVIDGVQKDIPKEFKKPWASFPQDLFNTLQGIIVSFKQNQRVITNASNKYYRFVDGKKVLVKQQGNGNWSARKPLHKATYFGVVNLKLTEVVSLANALKRPSDIVDIEVKRKVMSLQKEGKDNKQIQAYFMENAEVWSDVAGGKVEVYYMTKDKKGEKYYATRFGNDLVSLFAGKTEEASVISTIAKITDTGIQKILLAHFQAENKDAEQAFSPDGIERMNANIVNLNGGRNHKPIYTVRVFEKADKFPVGEKLNSNTKYVESAEGTNMFMVVYTIGDDSSERDFYQLPFKLALDVQKKYGLQWKEHLANYLKQNDDRLTLPAIPQNAKIKFILAVGDLVLLPMEDGSLELRPDRIYKAVSFHKKTCDFVPHRMSGFIHDTLEYTRHHKQQTAITGEMIKKTCVPLEVDRLGNARIVKIE